MHDLISLKILLFINLCVCSSSCCDANEPVIKVLLKEKEMFIKKFMCKIILMSS